MANSADPDLLASSGEASWSVSTLFEKVGCIRVQHDKGYEEINLLSYNTEILSLLL